VRVTDLFLLNLRSRAMARTRSCTKRGKSSVTAASGLSCWRRGAGGRSTSWRDPSRGS
jgi:hypothetical protein